MGGDVKGRMRAIESCCCGTSGKWLTTTASSVVVVGTEPHGGSDGELVYVKVTV